MTREPLAILMTIGITLAAILTIWIATLLDVDLQAALILAGVMAAGAGGTTMLARREVTPVDDPRDATGQPLK